LEQPQARGKSTKIEQLHYVLKSGYTMEKIQERSVDKIKTLALM
jgi:hypothetical protein